MMISMRGSLYGLRKDREGCIKLVLEIPKSEAMNALMVPEEMGLKISIETAPEDALEDIGIKPVEKFT